METKTKQQINYYTLLLFIFLGSIAFAPHKAWAATLGIQPNTTSVKVGASVSAKIYVNTQGKTINNAEAVIDYPTNLLDVTSVSSAGSIFSLWVENPTSSNGSVTFNGGVPNPGYTGSGGLLVTINFKAKASGAANISFSSAAVRENDGLGTNILTGRSGTSITIVENTAQPTPPPPTNKPTPPPTSSKPAEPSKPSDETISFQLESSEIPDGSRIELTGQAALPNDPLKIFLQSSDGLIRSYETASTAAGTFNFKSEALTGNSEYSVWVQGHRADGQMLESEKQIIRVKGSVFISARSISDKLKRQVTASNGVILLLLILASLGWYRYYLLWKILNPRTKIFKRFLQK